jgi:Flp pilus assembly protein TadD
LDSAKVILSKKEEVALTQLQKQARLYRSQGMKYQELGNFDAATTLYLKAIQIDPTYAAPYNDLGVIFEAKGYSEKAQECYLQAVKMDPSYLSSYSNLAMFYESQKRFDKAAYYWAKRADMGSSRDPWTIKARQRLSDIRATSNLTVYEKPLPPTREQEVACLESTLSVCRSKKFSEERQKQAVSLIKKAKIQQDKGEGARALKYATAAQQLDPYNEEIKIYIDSLLRNDNKALAASYMRKAKLIEIRGDTTTALKIAIDAHQLDLDNKKILAYIEKLQVQNLSK